MISTRVSGTGRSWISLFGVAILVALIGPLLLRVPNVQLTVLSLLALITIVAALWRSGEPPVLLFVVIFQWLQVSIPVFHADVIRLTLAQFMPWADLEPAVLSGLVSMCALAVGMRLAAGRTDAALVAEATSQAQGVDLTRLIQLHIGAIVAVELLFRFAGFSGIFQAVSALAQLRFATLFAVGYVALVNRRGVVWFALLCGLEVAQSLGGFFAGFRLPLYVAFLAAATRTRQFDARRVVAILGLAAISLYLAVVWQTIKGEYRDIASAGTGAQVVIVDRGEQVDTLLGLWADANRDVFELGVDSLARRLAYVDFLAYTMQFVPNTRPYQDGEVWSTALRHVLIPRLVWPEKPELYPDTEFTRDFTGLSLYAASRDTSISIGYVGDAYIDFGIPGMYVVMLGLGLMLGAMYRSLLRLKRGLAVLRFGVAVTVVLTFSDFGLSSAKVLGGVITVYLVGMVGCVLLLDPISRWLTERRAIAIAREEGG